MGKNIMKLMGKDLPSSKQIVWGNGVMLFNYGGRFHLG